MHNTPLNFFCFLVKAKVHPKMKTSLLQVIPNLRDSFFCWTQKKKKRYFEECGLPFVFSRRKSVIQIWNNMKKSKWQNFHFWVNHPFKYISLFPTIRLNNCLIFHLIQIGFVSFAESLQVYPDGIRHIRADKRVNEWKTPGKKTIVRCAVNQRQVVIALTGGELVYFEMDPVCWQTCFYLALSPECSSVVWMSLLRFLSFFTVWAAEWIHWEKGDVGRCGVHEFGKCASWWAAFPFPGCWVGGQYSPHHLPGSIRKLQFALFQLVSWFGQ